MIDDTFDGLLTILFFIALIFLIGGTLTTLIGELTGDYQILAGVSTLIVFSALLLKIPLGQRQATVNG